jgi:hypothetical protein
MAEENRPPRGRLSSLSDRGEIFDEFLRDWLQDRREGITMRSISEKMDSHIAKDETFQKDIVLQVQNVGTSINNRVTVLEANRERDAEDRLAGTGRFNAIPPAYPGFTQPVVTVNTSASSKRPSSHTPWWSREPAATLIKYVGLILIGTLAGTLGHHFVSASQAPPQAPTPAVHP